MNFNNFDLSGIKRFKKTLKQMQLNAQPSKENRLSVEIGSLAKEILTKTYAGTRFKVSDPEFNDRGFDIYATGYGISFDEFGTGAYADGTYKGKVPDKPITFTTIIGRDEESGALIRGKKTVSHWIYWYDNEFTKDIVDGRLGWWTGGNLGFQEGKVASNKFYDACQKIKDEVKEKK